MRDTATTNSDTISNHDVSLRAAPPYLDATTAGAPWLGRAMQLYSCIRGSSSKIAHAKSVWGISDRNPFVFVGGMHTPQSVSNTYPPFLCLFPTSEKKRCTYLGRRVRRRA